MEKIKVAIVGAGILGKIHAQAYAESEKAELVYICDVVKEKAKELAKQYNCDYTIENQKIAGDPKIKAVSVATPDFAHREVTLKMIEAGKDVLVEKPLATSLEDAQEIVKAAARKKVKLMVDFQNRWNPLFVQAKQTISKGEIGTPVMAYARLSNPLSVPLEMLSWASKSGPEWFLLPHTVDLVHWLLEKKPMEVYATGKKGVLKNRGIDVYDAIQALVRFEDDSFVTFETSWILPNSWPTLVDFKLMLLGTKGRIGVEGDRQGIDIATGKFSWPFVLGLQYTYGKNLGFFKEPILHFVDCILKNKTPMCSGAHGLATTRVIEAIIRSIEEKMVVKIES